MHREIGLLIENDLLDFPGKDSLATKLSQRLDAISIAQCRDMHDFDRHVWSSVAEQSGNMVGLPERQWAGTSGDPESTG